MPPTQDLEFEREADRAARLRAGAAHRLAGPPRSIARLKAKAEPGSDLDRWLDCHEADTRHDGESRAAQIARILKDEF